MSKISLILKNAADSSELVHFKITMLNSVRNTLLCMIGMGQFINGFLFKVQIADPMNMDIGMRIYAEPDADNDVTLMLCMTQDAFWIEGVINDTHYNTPSYFYSQEIPINVLRALDERPAYGKPNGDMVTVNKQGDDFIVYHDDQADSDLIFEVAKQMR